MAARGRDLRRKPAAERKADECHVRAWQRIQHFEVEMNEVVNRVEIPRPRRLTEART